MTAAASQDGRGVSFYVVPSPAVNHATCALKRLPIDLTAMTNLEHDYLVVVIVHQVDDPIIALPDSVLIVARQLLITWGSWIR
jgi:hypothetical protein